MQIDPSAAYTGAFLQQVIAALGEEYGHQLDALRAQRNSALDEAASVKALGVGKDARIAALQAQIEAATSVQEPSSETVIDQIED